MLRRAGWSASVGHDHQAAQIRGHRADEPAAAHVIRTETFPVPVDPI